MKKVSIFVSFIDYGKITFAIGVKYGREHVSEAEGR